MVPDYNNKLVEKQPETTNPFEELLSKKPAAQAQGHANMEELLSKFSIQGYGESPFGDGVWIIVNTEKINIKKGVAKAFCCCGQPKGICNEGLFFTIGF